MGRGQLPYTVDEFKNQTMMYYENYGMVRLTGATWQLITYLPLQNYDNRHDKLNEEINIMSNICKANMSAYEICSRLDNIFKIMFQEISVQREKMYESIGRYPEHVEVTTTAINRKKRGLINFVGTAMKTLFGVCDDDCAKESVKEINKIEKTNERMIHILKDQTTVVKSAVKGISSTSGEMNKLYGELVDKQGAISTKIGELVNKTNTLETLILSNRIHGIFTALIAQYSYETTTINSVITAARSGVLHPSLMTPRELANHLTQIKLKLPINLNLPMGTNPNEIYELSKITKMAVFYSGENQIVFVIKIPLVTELELTLYKILPIPQPVETMINGVLNKNHSIILKPEFQYVGITKNREQYTTFTETQLLHCKETEIFTICPEFSPVVHSNTKNPCEISLFKNPDILPETCETGILILSKDIFYKLKFTNTWIYATKGEILTIACRGNPEPYIHKLKNQGLITLNSDCRAYGNNIILSPTQYIKSKYYVNFIPQIGSGNLVFTVPNKIKDINLPKLVIKEDSHKLEQIHELAHSFDEVQKMIDSEIEKQSGHDIVNNKNNYLMYLTIGLLVFSLILIFIIYITYKCKLTSLRQPRYEMVRTRKRNFNAGTATKEIRGDIQVEQEQGKGKTVLPQIK